MASRPVFSPMGFPAIVTASPIGSRPIHPASVVGRLRLPSDPIGSTSVTFSGVAADSEIRVYAADMTELAGVENCVANQVLSWPVYAPGNPNNVVRVLIMGMPWRVRDFSYTSLLGSQVLPIQQEADKWYSNN